MFNGYKSVLISLSRPRTNPPTSLTRRTLEYNRGNRILSQAQAEAAAELRVHDRGVPKRGRKFGGPEHVDEARPTGRARTVVAFGAIIICEAVPWAMDPPPAVAHSSLSLHDLGPPPSPLT